MLKMFSKQSWTESHRKKVHLVSFLPWNVFDTQKWSLFYLILVSSGLWQVLMTHLKPWCLTPISTTIEEWWPTSLCLEVGSEKGTRSCRHILAKPTRSTSWGFSGQMSTQHRSCMWFFIILCHFYCLLSHPVDWWCRAEIVDLQFYFDRWAFMSLFKQNRTFSLVKNCCLLVLFDTKICIFRFWRVWSWTKQVIWWLLILNMYIWGGNNVLWPHYWDGLFSFLRCFMQRLTQWSSD